MESRWLGLLSYENALAEMTATVSQVRGTHHVIILGQEHPLVVTLGIRGNSKSDLLREDWPIVKIRRGGQATLHSPGQLVIYPILDLKHQPKILGIRKFVEIAEEITSKTLLSFGVPAVHRGQEPGVYSDRGKMAFFGFQVDRGVTLHGVSINVRNDLGLFGGIRSCGVSSEKFDRLVDYAPDAGVQNVFHRWTELFRQRLS